MLIFTRQPERGRPDQRVLLCGCGLVGSDIAESLIRLAFAVRWSEQVTWGEADARRAALHCAQSVLEPPDAQHEAEMHLVWSAGSGSFASSWTDLENERRGFDEFLDLSSRLARRHRVIVHFMSSAGGLFEGQKGVNSKSAPAPLRPYGAMKLEQELALADTAPALHAARIYRPSSVYGASAFEYRRGLISHLIWNAFRHRPTTLEDNIHALRDYVCVTDIGAFLASEIGLWAGGGGTETRFLVTAKPSSIFEVVTKVRRLTGRGLLIQHSAAAGNAADITFDSELLPEGWAPMSLGPGLRLVYRKTLDSHRWPVRARERLREIALDADRRNRAC